MNDDYLRLHHFLNLVSNKYAIIEGRGSNVLDFITEGEYREIHHLQYFVTARLQFRVTLEDINNFYYQSPSSISLELVVRIKDFSQDEDKKLHLYPLKHFSINRSKFDDDNILNDISKQIHNYLINEAKKVTQLYQPGKKLKGIIGRYPIAKFLILHTFSTYVFKNQLKMSNGCIRIKDKLKSFYSKNTIFVNEDQMFSTLRENIKRI